MKRQRKKQILEAAATLPPAKGRALLAAIAGKNDEAPRQDAADLLSDAAVLMEAAMIEAALQTLEGEVP